MPPELRPDLSLDTSGLTITHVDPASLRPSRRNARTHSQKQIGRIAESIKAFGFAVPLVIDEHGTVLAGHGRLSAAKQLGLASVPAVRLDHLSETQKRAFILADNKIALLAGWDRELLAVELGELAVELPAIAMDVTITGFALGEIDVLTGVRGKKRRTSSEEAIPALGPPVSQRGDVWQLGKHRIVCGDHGSAEDMRALMAGEKADMVFTDPRLDGRERGAEGLNSCLARSLGNAVSASREGALHFICSGWRNLSELSAAASELYSEQLNLIVWCKSTPGQGEIYRPQHELIAVYKVGGKLDASNAEFGRRGRKRSDVWTYSESIDTGEHAPKPVALVADAIKDATKRGAIVLDPFAGSGSTLIAAEVTGRRSRCLELDPCLVDRAIRRFEEFTGSHAVEVSSGRSFGEVAAERLEGGGGADSGGPRESRGMTHER
jgi:DNA modification methylase